MKKFFFVVISLLSLFFLACPAVNEDVTVETNVEYIELSSNVLELNVGDRKKIEAFVYPENAVNKDLVWESTDENVCYYEDGYVVANSVGEATIKVTSKNGKSAECVVFVTSDDIGNEEVYVEYKVEYYKEDLKGEYELVDSVKQEGQQDTFVNPDIKEFNGFKVEKIEGENEILDEEGIVVKIYYNRIEYTISFYENEDDYFPIETITLKYGATITPPENPTKKYHDFSKWNPSLPETIEGDLEVYAVWVEKEKTDIGITIY